jgi:hypothetical protein
MILLDKKIIIKKLDVKINELLNKFGHVCGRVVQELIAFT